MDVSAEAADLIVREGIQATEAAAKLAVDGLTNVAALLLAIAKQDMKVVGETTAKRLARDPAAAVVIPIKAEDKAKFQKLAKEFGVLYFIAQKKGNNSFTNGIQIIVSDAVYTELTGQNAYNEIAPVLKEGVDRNEFDDIVERLCRDIPGTTYISYEKTDRQLAESFEQIQLLAWGLILFVGLIGLLNIINTVYTNIHTRVTEIGMQRAIGMSAISLYKTFLWEGAYYGMIAAVIGSIVGYICTIFVDAADTGAIQLVTIPIVPILEAAVLSVGACLLATAMPLHSISRMNIVESIETVE